MWDRPDLLNALASTLYAAAAVIALYAGVLAVIHLPFFPLREVRVVEKPAHVTPEQVAAVVSRELRGNFFTIDLAAARAAFEKMSWVRRVQVRRQWPDRLDVTFEEHVPLARWGDRALVNVHGEVFQAAYEGELPVFKGPDGTAKEIAIQYQVFPPQPGGDRADAGPSADFTAARMAGEARERPHARARARAVEARLARFIAAYERTLAQLGRKLDYVDLRYPNGFAVRIPELRPEHALKRGRGA